MCIRRKGFTHFMGCARKLPLVKGFCFVGKGLQTPNERNLYLPLRRQRQSSSLCLERRRQGPLIPNGVSVTARDKEPALVSLLTTRSRELTLRLSAEARPSCSVAVTFPPPARPLPALRVPRARRGAEFQSRRRVLRSCQRGSEHLTWRRLEEQSGESKNNGQEIRGRAAQVWIRGRPAGGGAQGRRRRRRGTSLTLTAGRVEIRGDVCPPEKMKIKLTEHVILHPGHTKVVNRKGSLLANDFILNCKELGEQPDNPWESWENATKLVDHLLKENEGFGQHFVPKRGQPSLTALSS